MSAPRTVQQRRAVHSRRRFMLLHLRFGVRNRCGRLPDRHRRVRVVPCLYGGTCRESGTPQASMAADEYTCTCSAGFTGDNCAANVNDCASTPCQNSGACTDLVDRYTCSCNDGYSGTECQGDVDECWASCLNGATHRVNTCPDVNDGACGAAGLLPGQLLAPATPVRGDTCIAPPARIRTLACARPDGKAPTALATLTSARARRA